MPVVSPTLPAKSDDRSPTSFNYLKIDPSSEIIYYSANITTKAPLSPSPSGPNLDTSLSAPGQPFTQSNPTKSSPSQTTASTAPLPATQSGLNPKSIGVSIGVSAFAVIVIVLAVFGYYRLRKRTPGKIESTSKDNASEPDEALPYFQLEGELEARERYELPADAEQNELDGNEITELPATDGDELDGNEIRELPATDHENISGPPKQVLRDDEHPKDFE